MQVNDLFAHLIHSFNLMAVTLLMLVRILHCVTSFSQPDLTLTKLTSVIGESGTIYEVNIVVKHTGVSEDDAFSVVVTDEVQGMNVTEVTISPSRLNSTTQVLGSVNRSIVGVVPYLRFNESAKLVYRAIFLQDTKAAVSRSKAAVTWSASIGADKPTFGPVQTNETCAEKRVVRSPSVSGNHNFIIIGGVAGAVVGIIIAVGFLYCVNKCPTYRHRFIHTNSQGRRKKKEMNLEELPPYSYDYSELQSDTSDDEDDNIIIRVAKTFLGMNEDDDMILAIQPSDEMMWKSAIFRGDIQKANQGLKDHYVQDYVVLLEFSLKMWINLWRLILAHHIDSLYRDEQITWERKNKFIERLNTLFTNNFELPKLNTIDEYLNFSKRIILRSFNKGNEFHDNVLIDVRQGERKRMVRRCKDPSQLNKAAKYWEQIKASYKRSLFNDFGLLFGKYMESLHYVSSIYFTVRLTATSTGLLLVILERSINLVQKWLKTTMLKFMDMLKRNRCLSESVEQSFQRVFTKELKECFREIATRKRNIIESEEMKSISLHLQQMLSHKDTYTKLLILQSYISISSNEDVKTDIVPTYKIIDKFSICSQFAHSSELSAQNATFSFVRYSHSLLLEGVSQPLNTFITRMKHHVDGIFGEEAGKVTHGSKYEIILADTFQQMSDFLSTMDLKFDEIFIRLTDTLNENLETVEESGMEFQLFYNSLARKRKSDVPYLLGKIQLLFKSLIQCHCPLSFRKIERQIEKAPTSCISACTEQSMYVGLSNEYDFSKLVNKCSSKSFQILISSIMKKFEVLNDGIVEEVKKNHDAAMRYVNDFEPNLTSTIKPFQSRTFRDLYRLTKNFKFREVMLHTTCTFLINIFSSLENISNDTELTETVKHFVERITKIINGTAQDRDMYTLADGMMDAQKIQGIISIFNYQKGKNPNLEESQDDLDEEDIILALEKYVSICKTLLPLNDETGNAAESELSILTFDPDDIHESLKSIGEQYKYLKETTIMNADIMRESWEVMHLLWKKSFISRQQIYSYLRDLTYVSHGDFLSACKIILEKKVHINDIVSVLMITIGKRKAKKLWGKVSAGLAVARRLDRTPFYERFVLK